MVTHQMTLDHLKAELEEIATRYPNVNDDDLFVLWFLRAYVTEGRMGTLVNN